MKRINFILCAFGLALSAMSLGSCNNNDYYDYGYLRPTAVVTVRPQADGSFFMQLDDFTVIYPDNMDKSPFGDKEVRALVNYTPSVANDADPESSFSYARINWIDSLLTKQMAPNDVEDIDKTYGTDPVEILRGWTVVEDGYFTIDFATKTAGYGGKHWVNLVYTGDPKAAEDSEKYVVEFKHDADGDNYGTLAEGFAAFRLDGTYGLPDTGGETVKLTLKWNSYSGPKLATFNYCTRGSGASGDTGDGSGEGDLNEGGSSEPGQEAKLNLI